MFRGATKITLDDKGRMVMPTRYREQISELAQGKLVVTVDRDQCLLIYPLPEWEQIERKHAAFWAQCLEYECRMTAAAERRIDIKTARFQGQSRECLIGQHCSVLSHIRSGAPPPP